MLIGIEVMHELGLELRCKVTNKSFPFGENKQFPTENEQNHQTVNVIKEVETQPEDTTEITIEEVANALSRTKISLDLQNVFVQDDDREIDPDIDHHNRE